MARITGIGGLFFRARDPQALAAWYAEHLGINPVPTDSTGRPWTQEAGATVFAPFPADTDYFPTGRQWMLNLRTNDLDTLAARLSEAGIEVRTDPDWNSVEIGRFARIEDPEGNPIELWEPAEP